MVVCIGDSGCIAMGLEEAKRNYKTFFRDVLDLIVAGLVPHVKKAD